MRTPQRIVAKLLSEARKELGARRLNEVWIFCQKAERSLERRTGLSEHAITISPYKDCHWAVSFVVSHSPGVCRWIEIPVSFEQVCDDRTSIARLMRARIKN